jgi:hypothetical protein
MQVEHRRAGFRRSPGGRRAGRLGCAAVRTDSGDFESPAVRNLPTTGRSERRWRGRIEWSYFRALADAADQPVFRIERL